jgi:uncharacterized protein YbcI
MPRIDSDGEQGPGRLAAHISEATVAIVREYVGRGPTQVRTTISDDLVVVLMRDTMLKAERSLADAGRGDTVLEMRREFQRAMSDELVRMVESSTARRVVAFMSDNHLDPDIAAEVFVLDSTDQA